MNHQQGITGNASDVIYEHLSARFSKLAALMQTEPITLELILQEMETIQVIIHAEAEINSNSRRVAELIKKFEQIQEKPANF